MQRLGFIPGGRPIVGTVLPVTRLRRLPVEIGMPPALKQHPVNHDRMIAGQPQRGAARKSPTKQVERRRPYQAAIAMPPLWPRIGEEDKAPVDTSRGQRAEYETRIVWENPNIGQAAGLDLRKQRGHPVDKRVAAEKTDLRVGTRLRHQMLAGAKSNLQRVAVHWAPEQRAPVQQPPRIRRVDTECRQ